MSIINLTRAGRGGGRPKFVQEKKHSRFTSWALWGACEKPDLQLSFIHCHPITLETLDKNEIVIMIKKKLIKPSNRNLAGFIIFEYSNDFSSPQFFCKFQASANFFRLFLSKALTKCYCRLSIRCKHFTFLCFDEGNSYAFKQFGRCLFMASWNFPREMFGVYKERFGSF